MKKHLSLFLVLCMLFSMMAQVGINSVSLTAAPAIPVTETAAEEPSVNETADHVQGVMLFALDTAQRLEELEEALSAAGVHSVEPLFLSEGKAVGLGEKGDVWYRAQVTTEVTAAVEAVAALDGVCAAEPEYIYTAAIEGQPAELDHNGNRDWAYKKLHKHENKWWWKDHHDEAPGYGTVVAVIDTGVDYTHEDLRANMWTNTAEVFGTAGVDDDGNGYIDDIYGVDVTASGTKAGNPMDDHGHGTHVAGIIAMSSNGQGGVGLAYGTKIMAIKAGQSTGTLASTDIARAIQYAYMMGADVINMSFGGTGKSYLVEQALEQAFSRCVLVASAGNDGLPTTDAPPEYTLKEDIYPAGYTYVIGVMATDSNGDLASFSNWDYAPGVNCEYELTAPGVDIYSTLPGNRYAEWSGTSMAAPYVSAAAAILRSHYSDRDTYSSRFIMGQLTSATENVTNFVAPQGEFYAYPALNVYDSMTRLPQPNITVKDTFLMDNVMAGTPNDGDAIIDVGETVDLGVLVRNQWGATTAITVKADAISHGGVPNPYITFLTDTVVLEPAGTFAEVNNGFVWDDSYLTAIGNPIRFVVSPDAPNDTEIRINLTVTTMNGVDSTDTATYTTDTGHTFRVQAGRGIKGVLSEDTVLTNDYLWIVENSLLIPEGITLTVEPGTKIQFYSSDYENAYGGLTVANIVNEGIFNAIGTEDAPIEMFPGKGFEGECVDIAGVGVETLKYCNVINPRLGCFEFNGIPSEYTVDVVDCCTLTNNSPYYFGVPSYRYVRNGVVKSASTEWTSFGTQIGRISNTRFYNYVGNGFSPQNGAMIYVRSSIQNCLFDSCRIEIKSATGDSIYTKNNVFVGATTRPGNSTAGAFNSLIPSSGMISPAQTITHTYEGATSKYVIVTTDNIKDASGCLDERVAFDFCNAVAQSLGGSLCCINNAEEEEFVISHDWGIYQYNAVLGLKCENDVWKWIDDSTYEVPALNSSSGRTYGYLVFPPSPSSQFPCSFTSSSGSDTWPHYGLLEFPATCSDEDIFNALENFSYTEWVKKYAAQHTNNAILNPVLNLNPNTWTKYQADLYNSYYAPNYATNNYWGTENQMLINQMIIDADDYAGTYQDIIHDPILTLSSPSLAEIYPFVTQVYLTDSYGNIIQNAQPGETYQVHVTFNRDMDTTVMPSVTYGPADPYTDFAVQGSYITPRHWVGETTISPVMTAGTMYFRTQGGCAADDSWLVCGEDVLRFSFNITTSGVLAMVLNAAGGANKIELSWAQNDYDTLAGYNLYRSENPDGGFTKLNVSIISENSYTDTDVEPGVTYYYYFKVVNTEGNEEENASNVASAAPRDNIPPVIRHAAVTSAKAGTSISIAAQASDNIGIVSADLYYRVVGAPIYQKVSMGSMTEGNYLATIPASAVTPAGVEYYVVVCDADGNPGYAGTALVPNCIEVDGSPYISGFTPSRLNVAGGQTVTVLGGNFTEEMTLKLGGAAVADFTVKNSGEITFVAPANSVGVYALTLVSAEGKEIVSPTPITYIDTASSAQIPTSMVMTSAVTYRIPFYLSATGSVTAMHAEIDLPAADFSSMKAVKADEEMQFEMMYNYSGGTLTVSCMSAVNMITADSPLFYVEVVPSVNEIKDCEISLHDVEINGSPVSTVISGRATIKPSYSLGAVVKYYAGENIFIEGVTISAAGVKAVTGADGSASMLVSEKDVQITASLTVPVNAVSAYDASLVLQSAVGKLTLSEYQRLAADVDGSGTVNEYDASLILQKAVRKIDTFPCGQAWIFSPAVISSTMTTGQNQVTFIAISMGDVDGSYAGGNGN